MRIVLLSNEYPPFVIGGIATFTRSLAQGLVKKGVKVTIASGRPISNPLAKGRCAIESDDGIDVLRFSYPDIPPRHTMFQLANLKSLTHYIKDVDPDIIHGQSGSMFPASTRLKNVSPLVVTFHSSPRMQRIVSTQSILRGGSINDFQTYVLGYPAWFYALKKELQVCSEAVTVSKTLKFDLLKEMGERFSNKTHAINNGVNIESLDKDYNDVGSCDNEPDRTILFAGRLFWAKGVLRLLQIARLLQRELPDFKIIVNGKGPLLGKLSTQIRELGLTNVELGGFANRRQMMESLRRSSFVILPSYYEACPMALLEGMCLGKIPLMFNLEYAFEFTKGGTYGLIAENSQDLVRRLKQLCKESDLKSLSSEIQSFARKEYDITNTSEKYYQLYKNIHN